MEADLEELKMRVANLIARVSMVEAQIAEMDDDGAEQQILMGGGDGSTAPQASYSSYFKVYDASSGGVCKIGVKDGSVVDPLSTHCGFVWANGEVVGVGNYLSGAIEASGSIWVWLVTQIGPTGASSSVMTTSDSTAPSGYGYATQSQLLGRASIVSDGGSGFLVASINQDYLKGGEHMAVFFSDCALLEDE